MPNNLFQHTKPINSHYKKWVALSLLSLNCHASFADTFTYSYSSSSNVIGDAAERNDLFLNDDYSHLSIGPGVVRALKWTHDITEATKKPARSFDNEITYPLQTYIDYTRVDTKNTQGMVKIGHYESLTLGFSTLSKQRINKLISLYGEVGLGLGVANFKLPEGNKYRAAIEASLEGGLLLSETISIGVGVKRQIIGVPTETMATTTSLYLSTGISF